MQSPPKTRTPSLSVFFPAYNDGGTIASLVIRAVQVAGRLTPDFEVIVVNDGSSDATREIAAIAPAVVPVAAVALPLPPRERPADLARKAIPVKANKAAVDRKKKAAN